MAIWNRNKQLKESQKVTEASTAVQLDLSDLLAMPYYRFASSLTTLRSQVQPSVNSSIKDAMLKDPIISMIINMWISDTLAKDVLTQKVFDVEITKNEEDISESTITELNNKIDYLLENSNLDELLVSILYKVIVDGIVSVRLGFVDTYEDTKIKLFESNKKRMLEEASTWNDETKQKLLEAPTYDNYEDEDYKIRSVNKKKLRRVNGRYFFELLPARLIPIRHKGITILYLDLGNSVKVLNPRNITTFVNTRGGVKTLNVKDSPDDIVSTTYEIPLGQSFIENAVTPWSMMNTTEDCTLLALMTRSSIYRLFQVDVGALDTKSTEKFIAEFKKRLTTRETIDIRSQHYSSAQTQIPLGDSIIVPTRNGIGTINVQSVGADMDIKTNVPLDYFREQLLASLGVSKNLIYGDSSGALVNTSATRQDIRYLRTVQQFVSILSLGLEDIFKDYLTMIGVDISKIRLKVKFSQINSEEALQRMEYEQTKQEALDRAVTSLENLGISFKDGGYINTRNELIKRYMDNDLLDFIIKDEKENPPLPETPSEGDEGGIEPLPGGSVDHSEGIDVPPSEGPIGEISGDGFTEEPGITEELPTVEPTSDTNISENPPYSNL